jgi:regulator of protease activity HflC (stomatin/prohibitin superfamily)
VNQKLRQIIDEQTEPWGIKVTSVAVKDVGLMRGMRRAMARRQSAEGAFNRTPLPCRKHER